MVYSSFWHRKMLFHSHDHHIIFLNIHIVLYKLVLSAPENIFNIMKIVDILCQNIMQNMKTKFRKKSFGEWYLNENII